MLFVSVTPAKRHLPRRKAGVRLCLWLRAQYRGRGGRYVESTVCEIGKTDRESSFSLLWITRDAGCTWEKLGGFPDVFRAYIHPATDELFVAVVAHVFDTDADGYVYWRERVKLLSSDEGIQWNDITGAREYIDAPFSRFFVCSLLPGVCLEWAGTGMG